jgi:hypothetical protein
VVEGMTEERAPLEDLGVYGNVISKPIIMK